MKKALFGTILCLMSVSIQAQYPQHFNTGIDTEKKPWSHLDFYNDPDNFQFVIVTDRTGGMRPGIFEDAVDKINMLYPEFVVSVGDLIQGYTRDTAQIEWEWEEFNNIISGLKVPFFYLPGNHDITNQLMAEIWEEKYGKRYYHFTYKNTLYIIMDSNDDDHHNLTEEQTGFVIETLDAHPDVRWTFLLMHHPIWNYDTGGRFQEIETALQGRQHTILAGHTHHYYYEKKHGSEYIILGTTGGGSRLRGHYFGEFDHIVWVTMTEEGPSMANLRLDGILKRDIVNPENAPLARNLAENANFRHVMLCNTGERFTEGTLYFYFDNPGDRPLEIDLNFYHQHQLNIQVPKQNLSLAPGTDRVVEIPVRSPEPVDFDEVELLQFDWQMEYELAGYPDFRLAGRQDLPVRPTRTTFLGPRIPKFLESLQVSAAHPFENLDAMFTFNGKRVLEGEIMKGPEIMIDQSGEVSLQLMNEKGQVSGTETRPFEKLENLEKAVRVRKPQPGLRYSYYEGEWDGLPDFNSLKQASKGVADEFNIPDFALRPDHFGMVFSGYFLAEEDGLYVFRSSSDDAARLVIHSQTVLNQDRASENFSELGAIALEKGYHPVKIHFLEQAGRERLRLYMKKTYDESWERLEIKDRFFY